PQYGWQYDSASANIPVVISGSSAYIPVTTYNSIYAFGSSSNNGITTFNGVTISGASGISPLFGGSGSLGSGWTWNAPQYGWQYDSASANIPLVCQP
ncbi:MAG: hypothetical protein ACYDCW_07940, partial [Acidithiobacillus ferrivorans]